MTLTRREKIMITVGAVVISLTGYIFYFLIPNTNGIVEAGARLKSAQSRATQLNFMAAQADKLEQEIQELDSQLDSQAATLPTGVSHAEILLYLKELTQGQAEELEINMPSLPMQEGHFQVQAVTLDFRASYEDYISILSRLKENKRFNRATFVEAVYAPVTTEEPLPTETPAVASPTATASSTSGVSSAATGTAQVTEAPTPAATATATPMPVVVVDDNVLKVHIELSFYALPPGDAGQAKDPVGPTVGQRADSLFPEE